MPGPCSLPQGNSSKMTYDDLTEIVCDMHFKCNMAEFDKHGNEVKHDYIIYREWLARRNRLRTGKSV